MKRIRKVQYLAALGLTVLLTAGCGSSYGEQQQVYRQYGINCLQEGKYAEAAEYFQKALDQSIGKVTDMEKDICYYKAEALYRSGDTRGAIDTYTALIHYSGDPQAYYLRGRLYYSIGTKKEKAQADKDFAAAVEEAPQDYEVYIGIYEALQGQKGATDYLQRALEIKGEEPEDHMQKGRIYYLLGDTAKARDLLEKALGEGQALANLYLTEVYEAAGDVDSAEETFQTYLDSGLADADGLFNIGMLQMKSGEYDHAVRCFETALSLEKVPNRQLIEKNRIVAYEYSGDFKTAKSLMKEYQKSYPSDTSMEDERIFLETR